MLISNHLIPPVTPCTSSSAAFSFGQNLEKDSEDTRGKGRSLSKQKTLPCNPEDRLSDLALTVITSDHLNSPVGPESINTSNLQQARALFEQGVYEFLGKKVDVTQLGGRQIRDLYDQCVHIVAADEQAFLQQQGDVQGGVQYESRIPIRLYLGAFGEAYRELVALDVLA